MTEAREGLTYERDFQRRGHYVDLQNQVMASINDTLSEKIIKKFNDRNGNEIWPWQNEKYQSLMF